MKKYVIAALCILSGVAYAQEKNEPVLEAVGQSVKATYYYDNGKVQQVGYFKDGKLDGKWTAYNENGAIRSVAEYKDGMKSGTWVMNSGSIQANEVDFANNQIVAVRQTSAQGLAVKN